MNDIKLKVGLPRGGVMMVDIGKCREAVRNAEIEGRGIANGPVNSAIRGFLIEEASKDFPLAELQSSIDAAMREAIQKDMSLSVVLRSMEGEALKGNPKALFESLGRKIALEVLKRLRHRCESSD